MTLMTSNVEHDLILGTAGHIDHGKTALVRALTGVDTDRLPEEKKRGITIELGFAQLALDEYRLGIVDVPGHERFVRNMLAGASGIDLALLVVAADDSVKPQTREHLEILRLLRLEAGVIALTKCDLPDPEWIDLVEAEVRELVADTFLAEAPIVRTSALAGTGLEELRTALHDAAGRAVESRRRQRALGPFRLPIDRTFTIAGHGTVVTGSVSGGGVRIGDELVIEPGGHRVRVRGLQNHDQTVDEVHRGQRAAINLVGVRHDEICRGQELASPGHLVPSKLLTVRLNLLESAPRPLKHRGRVHFHLGTAELMASVVLLDRDELLPGDWAPAQLFLNRPVVSTWQQAFVIRSESPVVTIGGGQVLDPQAIKIRRSDAARVARLADLWSSDPIVRASAALYFNGLRPWQPLDLARAAGIDDVDGTARQLAERGELVEIAVSPTRRVRAHRDVLREVSQRIEELLKKLHEQNPLQALFDPARIYQRLEYLGESGVLEATLTALGDEGRVRWTERGVALASHGPQLSRNEQRLLEELIERYRAAGFEPPTIKEVQSATAKNQAAVPQLLALAASEGELVPITNEYYLHAESEARMRELLRERLADGSGLTVSQIRELLSTTRKYAVPLCEYLDRSGFTRRQGDVRVLANPAPSASP